MKLRYKFNLTWLFMGLLFLGIAAFLYLTKLPEPGSEFYNKQLTFFVFLPVLISIYYFCMPLITYVKVTDKVIRIHKNSIIFAYKIDRNKLSFCKTSNRNLVFYMKDDKNYSMNMDWVDLEKLLDLIYHLQSFTAVYEEGTKTAVDVEKIKAEMLIKPTRKV